MIGDPPSLIGGSHSKSTKSLSQSTILGAVVALGSSKNHKVYNYSLWNFDIKIFYIIIPNGFLAIIEWSATSGSDSPSEFTADTRKVYSWPGIKLDTVKFGSLHLPAGTQRPKSQNRQIISFLVFQISNCLLYLFIYLFQHPFFRLNNGLKERHHHLLVDSILM